MDVVRRITELIEPAIGDLGYEVVRIVFRSGTNATLQIMAERTDGQLMTVDDCAEISNVVSALLDVEDPITEAYALEVSSPGIDRPLTRFKDFERFAGFEAKMELRRPHEGRKRFRGRLAGVRDGGLVAIRLDDGAEAALPFDEISSAKLILTDELIAAVQDNRS
ncbi:ribosome maturation factor RimP [Tistrella bauzanensis]|uniref:Ribosome maturation factor RimP n=2 Tax=Tistrella TaxID=171436 RepID=A0ABU9YH89_9PROT|nr:ribosome maturation factor RimP [Tistrella bauzanensis]GGB34628.1 ribosome maturation factor RimP [Tistrella bauzanensis]